MEDTPSFGQWLKRRRKDQLLTQEALAKLVGCAAITIRKIEANELHPSQQIAEQLAQHLELETHERATFITFARTGRRPVSPPTTADASGASSQNERRTNLPVQRERLIGREPEVAEVVALLRRPSVGLITLTGPGGVGKTRLSQQGAAELLDDFADGVWLVELAPITDPLLVPSTIASALEVTEQGGQPIKETLKAFLREKQLLLLLDNFEQVVRAAGVVAELLKAAPRLKVLVTSREVLHLSGEQEYPVPPLALPDPMHQPTAAQLSQYAAVALFIQRAQAAKPDFQVTNATAPAVAEICVRLDGLPLAIELAAARVKIFPAQALLTRLDHRLRLLTGGARDLTARQQTLRGAIDWSYQLLTATEQSVFARLGVFVGGCTLEAVEAVCDAEGSLNVLDAVASLVDKSLVRQAEGLEGEPRFRMLETIREYALEQLEARGELAAVLRRHAAFFLALAEAANPHIMSGTRRVWIERLEAEHDNLRAALVWSQGTGTGDETGVSLVGALAWFWYFRGYFSEAYAWINRMWAQLGPTGVAAAPSTRAWARLVSKGFFPEHFDPPAQRAILEQSVAMCRRVGDKCDLVLALNGLGMLAAYAGDYAAGRAWLEESVAVARELDDTFSLGWALGFLGRTTCDFGDYETASAVYEEGLARARRGNDAWLIAFNLEGLADVAAAQQRPEQAASLYAEGRAYYQTIGDRLGVASCMVAQARAAETQGETAQAKDLYQESLVLMRELGNIMVLYVEALEGLAGLASAEQPGGARKSARLYGAAEALREAIVAPITPAVHLKYERDVDLARAQLDEAAFETAWAEGRTMTLEQATAYALEEAPDA